MKKIFFMAIALIAAAMMAVSCSDKKDDPVYSVSYLTGNYGKEYKLTATVNGKDVAETGATVSVIAPDYDKGDFTINGLVPGVKKMEIKDVPFTPNQATGTYDFSTSSKSGNTTVDINGSIRVLEGMTINITTTQESGK